MPKRLSLLIVFSLIVGATVTISSAVPVLGDRPEIKRQVQGDRISVSNDAITLVVVAGGKHPNFFWYANNNNKTVYNVQFKGITEYVDYGQNIYQRKFNADLKNQIDNQTVHIRALNASKVGSLVLISGHIKENRNPNAVKIYNYMLTESGAEIGVNVTKGTAVQGELDEKVIVKGIVKNSSNTLYIEAKNIASIDELEEDLGKDHPAFFEFNEAKWNFSGFKPIKSGNTTIGYQFSFTIQSIKNPHFSNLNNQIEIRGRLYNTTVKEGNVTVTSASVKTDIIIKSWQWNLDNTAANILNLNISKDKLAVWLEMTAFNTSKVDDAISGKAKTEVTHVKSDDEKIDASHHGEETGEDEKELRVKGSETKLSFASNSTVLGGYFNFTNYAYVYTNASAPTTGVKVPVTASYLADDHKLRLFLVYPNFGNKSLEHDPTMGAYVTGVSTTPQYVVNSDSGTAQPAITSQTTKSTAITTTPSQSATSTATTTTGLPTELTYALAAIAVIAAIAAVMVIRKRA
ncbi:MAG: hypothetical protein M1503_04015 [Thaumarchaeota archaeon]|nr:hypothetical protein [Nitrososphaerota archaeon]